MRNRFDWLGKEIGKAALGPCGFTKVQHEITSETLAADIHHEPDPDREDERERLGLLGRMASRLCLIELFGHAPRGSEFRACLTKHLVFWQERARKHREDSAEARQKGEKTEPFIEPFLWIVTAGRPRSVLKTLKPEPAAGWPSGVLFSGALLRVGVVVASELPRDRSTLLVRLMAAGPLLSPAIKELRALSEDAPERAMAERKLLELNKVLGEKPRRSRREQEFVMTMMQTWEDARIEGRQEGRAEEAARAVLTALRVRGLEVPESARERILAEKDLERLVRWHEKAITAATVAELFDEPS